MKKKRFDYSGVEHDAVIHVYDRKKGRWVVDSNSEIGEIKQ